VQMTAALDIATASPRRRSHPAYFSTTVDPAGATNALLAAARRLGVNQLGK
jgi:hypothetical protein